MNRITKFILPALILVLAALIGSPVMAQTATGTVDGTVKDASGAIIPGVEVTLTNVATNSVRSTVTDEGGRFRITNVPSGNYRAEAQLTGFSTAAADFKLEVAGLQTLNFVMEIGEVSTVLEVTDVVQKVNTEEGRLSSVVEEKQVVDLPLNGRNVFQLALLQPGVTQSRGSGIGGTQGINASGNRSRGNNFSLDGVSNNDPISGGVSSVDPNPDIVAEFKIQNNNFSAEYGRNNGAIINVVTKSGSNDFHGTVWWFHRNDALDARETFDEEDAATLRRHEAGFTFGGPIKKNKTFFFGGLEVERDFSGESGVARYETPELRQLVRDQFAGSLADQLFQAFPGPNLTGGFADAGSVNGVLGGGGPPDGILDTGTAVFAADELFKRTAFNIRVDHEVSDSNKAFFRWIGDDQTLPFGCARGPENCDAFDGYFANGIFSDTHIFSPTVVNEFRFGYNRNRSDFTVGREDIPDLDITFAGSANITGFGGFAGEPQFFTGEEYNLVDVVSLNKGSHGIKTGFEYRWNQDDSDFQFLNRGYIPYLGVFDFISNLPYFLIVRVDPNVGGELPIISTPRNFRQSEFAFFVQDDWKISDRWTLNLGVRYDNYGQISEERGRLANLELGPGADVFERVAFATVGRVDSDGIFGRDNNNFSPRIGFAWDIFGDGRTSLRGGFGVAYDRLFLNVTGNIRFNPPDSAQLGLYSFFTPIGTPQEVAELLGATTQVPFPRTLQIPGAQGAGFSPGGTVQLQFTRTDGSTFIQTVGGSLRSPDPSLRSSYSQNWFLGIQRELPWDMLFEANYTGNAGRKLGFIEQYNRFNGARFGAPNPFGNPGVRLNPFFTSENLRTNNINSSHNGGNLSLTKRFSKGLAFQSAFTFGKTLDFNSDNFGSNAGGLFTPDPRRLRDEWGLAGFHVGKRWVSNFIWEIPFMKDQQGFLGEIAGGWQLQGIFSFQDGTPYTPRARSSTQDYNGDFRSHDRLDAPTEGSGPYNGIPRNQYRTGVFGSTGSAARGVFNPNGLPGDCDGDGRLGPADPARATDPACIGFGTLGRSNFFNPGYNNIDLSLFKHFRTPWFGSEDGRLEFRAEFFNIFNRTNFNAVQESFTSSFFGRSTSASDAREVQFALKFIF